MESLRRRIVQLETMMTNHSDASKTPAELAARVESRMQEEIGKLKQITEERVAEGEINVKRQILTAFGVEVASMDSRAKLVETLIGETHREFSDTCLALRQKIDDRLSSDSDSRIEEVKAMLLRRIEDLIGESRKVEQRVTEMLEKRLRERPDQKPRLDELRLALTETQKIASASKTDSAELLRRVEHVSSEAQKRSATFEREIAELRASIRTQHKSDLALMEKRLADGFKAEMQRGKDEFREKTAGLEKLCEAKVSRLQTAIEALRRENAGALEQVGKDREEHVAAEMEDMREKIKVLEQILEKSAKSRSELKLAVGTVAVDCKAKNKQQENVNRKTVVPPPAKSFVTQEAPPVSTPSRNLVPSPAALGHAQTVRPRESAADPGVSAGRPETEPSPDPGDNGLNARVPEASGEEDKESGCGRGDMNFLEDLPDAEDFLPDDSKPDAGKAGEKGDMLAYLDEDLASLSPRPETSDKVQAKSDKPNMETRKEEKKGGGEDIFDVEWFS